MELLEFPVEVLLCVAQHLKVPDLLTLCSLNKRAFEVFKCNEFWLDQVIKTNELKSINWRNDESMSDVYAFTDGGGLCYDYCMKKLDQKQHINILIDEIAKWKNGDVEIDEDDLAIKVDYTLKHIQTFIPFTTNQIMRITNDEMFLKDPNVRLTVEHFKELMNERSKHLQRIDIACTLNDLGGDIMFIYAYRSILYESDEYINDLTLEEVYVMASSIDPLFHDLLHIRATVTANVIRSYNESIRHLEETGVITKNENRIHFIMKLFDYEKKQWGKWEDNLFPPVDDRDLQNSLILRVYAGLAVPTQLVYNSIILRFCKLLGIGNVIMNEIAIGVEENGQCDYLVHLNYGIKSFNVLRPEVFGQFPIFFDKFTEFQNNDDTKNLINKLSWRRYIFINVLDSFLTMTHFNDFKLEFDANYVSLTQQGCKSYQAISGVNVLAKSHLSDLRSRIISMTDTFEPTVISGQNCLQLISQHPKTSNYTPTDPYIPSGNSRLLDSFRYIPNEVYDNETNAKRINFEHNFEYRIGDLVNAGFLANALVLDLFLPNDSEITEEMSIEEKTQVLNDDGLLLLLSNHTCYVINIMLIQGHSKVENGGLMFLDDDHIGIWFKSYDQENNKFIPY